MNYYLIGGGAGAIVCGGALVARLIHMQRQSKLIAARMRQLRPGKEAPSVLVADKKNARLALTFPVPARILSFWEELLYQNALTGRLPQLSLITLILGAGVPAAAFGLGLPAFICLPAAIVLSSLPTAWLFYRRARVRAQFVQQLPAAIDLMISVLKSGHSIPQAIQSIAEEMPYPCGAEFSDVWQRLKLGQSLAASLFISAQRLSSFDLDLIARAVAIQLEVGGSLSDLLDKTNTTIKHRIKLARQIKALTAQGRLSAIIVGLMPFVLAAILQSMKPGYLNPLFTSNIGKALLAAAFVLQIAGIFIMTRLSSLKV